jgi:hypothetical protein
MSKNFTNSDIFNSYIEIAQQKGLVSLAEDDWKKSKDALEKNPRADSLTQEKIEKLYNLKPQSQKGMDYKKNIMEVAHPSSVVIAPSYDKLNGLVENNNQRQNILLRIVDKRTNGLLTQHKYARDEMVRALVRVANDMDNRDEDSIRTLADECIESLTKEGWSLSEILSGSDVPSFLRPFISAVRADVPAVAIGTLAGAVIGSAVPIVGTLAGAGTGAQVGLTAGLILGPIVSAMFGQAPEVRNMAKNSDYVIEALKEVIPHAKNEKSFLENFLQEVKKLKKLSEDFYGHAVDLKEKSSNKEEITESHVSKATESTIELNNQIGIVENLIEQYLSIHTSVSDEYKTHKNIGDAESKIREWLSPMFTSINAPLALKDAVLSLDEAIGKHMEAKMTAAERAEAKLEKYYQRYKQQTKNFLFGEKSDAPENKPSSSVLTQSPSNDNAEAARKAAMQRLARLIKNS